MRSHPPRQSRGGLVNPGRDTMSDASRRQWLGTAGVMALMTAAGGSATAQTRPSADDLVTLVKGARVFDLSFVWNDQAPVLSLNPPYSFALNRTHKMTHEIFGQAPGSRVSWASDIMYFQRPARRAHRRRHRPHRA